MTSEGGLLPKRQGSGRETWHNRQNILELILSFCLLFAFFIIMKTLFEYFSNLKAFHACNWHLYFQLFFIIWWRYCLVHQQHTWQILFLYLSRVWPLGLFATSVGIFVLFSSEEKFSPWLVFFFCSPISDPSRVFLTVIFHRRCNNHAAFSICIRN